MYIYIFAYTCTTGDEDQESLVPENDGHEFVRVPLEHEPRLAAGLMNSRGIHVLIDLLGCVCMCACAPASVRV